MQGVSPDGMFNTTLFYRVRDLSEHVEKKRRESAPIGNYDELMSEFNIIKHEIDAFTSCLEEGTQQLNRVFGRQPAQTAGESIRTILQ